MGSTLKRNYIPISIRVTWWSYQFKSCKCVWLLCVNQIMQSYAFSEQDNILELAGVKDSNVWLPARWYFELTFQIVLPPASHWCIMSAVKINCWLNLGFTRSSVFYFPASRCALGKIPNVAPTEIDAVCEMWIYDGLPVDLLHSTWIKLAWMNKWQDGVVAPLNCSYETHSKINRPVRFFITPGELHKLVFADGNTYLILRHIGGRNKMTTLHRRSNFSFNIHYRLVIMFNETSPRKLEDAQPQQKSHRCASKKIPLRL